MGSPSLGFNLNPSGNQSALPQGAMFGGSNPYGLPTNVGPGTGWNVPAVNPNTGSESGYPSVPSQPGVPQLPGNIVPQGSALPGGQHSESPLDPYLTSQLYNWLSSQIGQGATPYTGQLTAPVNQTIQQIAGNDYALTDFDAVQQAMQRQIQEGAANLKGSEAFAGNLAGTPFGTSMTDYQNQAAQNLQSILAQMELQAAPTRLAAGQAVQQQEQLGLTNAYQEWLRQQPEYSPLLSMEYGASTTFPPVYGSTYGIGAGGAALGALPSIIGLIQQSMGKSGGDGSGGISSLLSLFGGG